MFELVLKINGIVCMLFGLAGYLSFVFTVFDFKRTSEWYKDITQYLVVGVIMTTAGIALLKWAGL